MTPWGESSGVRVGIPANVTYCKQFRDFVGFDVNLDVTVYPDTPEGYRKIVNYLKDKNAQFYTHQLHKDKCFRAVIRDLRSSTPLDEIKTEIESLGFRVKNTTNIVHRVTKLPLSLFYLDLYPDKRNKEIFRVSALGKLKIKIEEPYAKKSVVQCTRCQAYGRWKHYCQLRPRCVKCAGYHLTSSCKPHIETPKCALCGGVHPANYRGCTTYTELKKREGVKRNSQQERQPPPIAEHDNRQNLSVDVLQTNDSYWRSTIDRPSFADQVRGHSQPQTSSVYHPDDAAQGGTAIIIRNNLIHLPLPYTPATSIMATVINIRLNNKPITIASIYCPPNKPLNQLDFQTFFRYLGPRFLCGGDYNAKHQYFGCRTTNPRGNHLLSCLPSIRHTIDTPSKPTYWPTSRSKLPGLFDLSNGLHNMGTSIDTLNDLSSDHSPVLLSLDAAPQHVPARPSLVLGQIDWVSFQMEIESDLNLHIPLKTPDQIDSAVHDFVSKIQQSICKNTYPHNCNRNYTIYAPLNIRLNTEEKTCQKDMELDPLPLGKTDTKQVY
ncbi:hypothetical protein AAG570_006224 [Ranatra chinensis]|uniref:Pre-C2HC domain-containing protein n=1 Tax=Ranatra chinensis TaxID=642074 RepID=A0ABD0ZEK6_9HEMI